jgi:hypothetical protein
MQRDIIRHARGQAGYDQAARREESEGISDRQMIAARKAAKFLLAQAPEKLQHTEVSLLLGWTRLNGIHGHRNNRTGASNALMQRSSAGSTPSGDVAF